MRIALYNLEPKIENTALMQISFYHKCLDDSIEWYSPLFHTEYDKIYAASLFTFSDKRFITSNMICGGTGFNPSLRLPKYIEDCDLDYSIYPHCKTSYLWFSRGCFRKCPFCVVPIKESKGLHVVTPKNVNPKSEYITVMDDTFTANPNFIKSVDYLKELKLPVDIQCGIDARIFCEDHGKELKRLKHYKQIHTAWDSPKDDLSEKLELMAQIFGRSRIQVYVLIGYWSTPQEDLDRVTKIQELGLDAWIMPYNKRDPYQKAFMRWCNRHVNCDWLEYHHGSWSLEQRP